MNRPFTFDAAWARQRFAQDGWFVAANAVSADLMTSITDQVAEMLGTGAREIGEWRYPDKKSQFLWEPATTAELDAICRSVAEATGLDPDRTMISERHLKVYSDAAPEMPPAHKDRSASAVTVGIGIDIPEDSRLVLWPDVDPTYNPYPTAAEWRETRHEHELPEHRTAGVDPIEVDLRRGDVVMFRGANLYHERYLPARTAVMYLKFNDLGLDPLGEDPRTLEAESRTHELLAAGVLPAATVVANSPRLVGIRTDELFPELGVISYARLVQDERAVRLEPDEVRALRELRHGAMQLEAIGVEPAVVEGLARRGLVTLR